MQQSEGLGNDWYIGFTDIAQSHCTVYDTNCDVVLSKKYMLEAHFMLLFSIWPGASNLHNCITLLSDTFLHTIRHTDTHASDTSQGSMA